MAKKILIVEDNPNSRVLLKDILQFYRYEVIEAGNGEEGIQMAKEEKPDLIFMDLQMPIMDGYSAGEMLKNDPETKGIKIIAVTSYAMRGDKEKVMEKGFDGYVAKPINTRELTMLVKEYLGE